jgi:hypothetical protein
VTPGSYTQGPPEISSRLPYAIRWTGQGQGLMNQS